MEEDQLNDLSYRIIGAGIEVHRTIGPGLLETTYPGAQKDEHLSEQERVMMPLLIIDRCLSFCVGRYAARNVDATCILRASVPL